MTHTILDLREPIQHSAEGALEHTGHEQLTEQFRAALKDPQTPAQTEPEAPNA